MPYETLIWRDYQVEARQAPQDCYLEGKRKTVLSLPTGAGKTIVAGGITQEFLPRTSYGMMLVPRLDLVSQTHDKFTQFFFDTPQLGIIQGDQNDLGRWFTIASKPTLENPSRLQQYLRSIGNRKVDLLFVDECHLSITKKSSAIINALLSDYGMLVGLSGTPMRQDGQSLAKIYTDGLIYSKDIWELIRDGYLADIASYSIDLGEHLHVLSSERYQIAYDAWYSLAKMKRTLIFGKNMTDVRNFFDFFTAKGAVCHVITGYTDRDERKEVYQAFKQGTIQVLINFGVMTTGNDIEEIECIILDRFTDNPYLWAQMIGRGLRLAPWINKEKCIVLNLTNKHHPLLMFTKLFGSLTEIVPSVRQMIKEKDEKEEEEKQPYEHHPIGTSVQLNGVTATTSNMLLGNGWQEHPVTHDWQRSWIYQDKEHQFLVEKAFTGDYQPVHIDAKGRRHVLSKELLSREQAQRCCQQFLGEQEYKFKEKKEREAPENWSHPIRESDFDYLFRQRKIQIRPEGWKKGEKVKPSEEAKAQRLAQARAEMTNGDAVKMKAHLARYGGGYSPAGGYLQYVIGQGMYVTGRNPNYAQKKEG